MTPTPDPRSAAAPEDPATAHAASPSSREDLPPIVERLARLIRIPTISVDGRPSGGAPAFAELRAAMGDIWPAAFAELDLEDIQGALLLTWRGSDPALAREPAVLMAHQDVVGVTGLDPKEATTGSAAPGWTVPPFEGRVADGLLWGRGALDDKAALACVLEAVDALVREGVRPAREVVCVFGCDEETHGSTAHAVARELERRGVRPWLVLDEGGAVVQGALPGVRGRTAMVGVSEKGTLDVLLHTSDAGGHASTPSSKGAVYRLARALTRLERRPMPATLTEPVIEMLERAAPHAGGRLADVYARARRLAPAIAQVLARTGPETAALVRTTVAPTRLTGAPGANVLANEAGANLNVRVQTGETTAKVVARLRRTIHDPSMELDVLDASEPSPVSPAEGPQWEALEGALAVSHPDAVMLPYVQLGASDSRWFTGISRHVYRFTPFFMTAEERGTLHGLDERIQVESLARGPVFYGELLRRL